MGADPWTKEENEQFKNALKLFSAFFPARFENIAEHMQKSVADVMEHYQELVHDLLEIGSSQIDLSDEQIDVVAQSSYPAERTIWNKEEHEWFLIGLKRFGKDWDKIATLLDTKSPRQVAIYAHNYFHWQNSKKNGMKRVRGKDVAMVDLTDNEESSLHQHPQSQPPLALQIGQHLLG